MDEQPIEVNEEELTEYIFMKLLSQGVIVSRSDIKRILSLEYDYMVEIGLIKTEE